MRIWFYVYLVLFITYMAFEVAGSIDAPKALWLKSLSKWSYVPLTLLLSLLIYRSEIGREELLRVLRDASSARNQLRADLEEMARLKEQMSGLKNEIETMRQQLRSSDALLHGKLLFYQQKYDEAASLFDEVVKEDPSNPQNRYWLGLSLLRNGDARKALPHLTEAANTAGDPEFWKVLGEAEFKLRMPEQAAHHFQKALESGIRNKEETMMLLAKAQLQFDRELAKSTLRKMVDENPYNGNAVDALVDILIEEGDYNQAIDVCDRALAHNSRNWIIYPRRAEALLLRDSPGDQEKARKDLDKARLGNPRDYNIYRIEGQYLTRQALATTDQIERQNLLRKAIKVYKDGLELIPGGYKAAFNAALSFVYILLKELEQAEQAARDAVKAYPDHINNHLALCAALLANKRWPALQRAAQKARDVASRPPGRIYSYLYDILAALAMRECLRDLKEEIRNLIEELRAMPSFRPQRAEEWRYVRAAAAIESIIEGLSGKEKELMRSIVRYLDGDEDNVQFVSALESIVA